MPFDVGIPELALVLVVVLVVFGPARIPELARDFGKMVRDLRRMAGELTAEFTTQLELDQPAAPRVAPARRVCSKCSTPNPLEHTFCSQCGASLVA